MQRAARLVCLMVMVTCLTISAIAQEQARSAAAKAAGSSTVSGANREAVPGKSTSTGSTIPMEKDKVAVESALRVEGEQRFRTNCGRCHMAPHKFPPRVMATAIRHMRVRATLTDEDMQLILHYMTR